MEKYNLREEIIENDDGTKVKYNVLSKARVKRIQAKELIQDKYYNILMPSEIWFSDEEKPDIMKALK